jgi:hypothetical protein
VTPGLSPDIDDRVLELRESGRDYPSIARLLRLHGANVAHECFLRAMARRPPPEQRLLRERERRRLEELSTRISHRADRWTTSVQERLQLLDQLQASYTKGRSKS